MKLRTLLPKRLLKAAALCTAIFATSTTDTMAAPGALNFSMRNFIDVGTINQNNHSYTKEAWIKAKANTTHNIITGGDEPFWLHAGHLRAAHGWQTGYPSLVEDTATFPLNVWVHVAISYDSASRTARLYRDGELVAYNVEMVPYKTSFEQVGAYNDSNPFDGDIDEVRMWSRALCQREIKLHMNTELKGTEDALEVYYKFNEGLPLLGNLGLTSVLDASGKGRNGTLKLFSLLGDLGNFVASKTYSTDYVTFVPPVASITSTTTATGATLMANDMAGFQWWKDNSWISGANSRTYNATPGNYRVTITAPDGCTNTSATTTINAATTPTPQPPVSNLSGTIAVSPVKTVSGQEEYTIYDGYGPQNVTLTAMATGGTGPYTYQWSGDDIENDSRCNYSRNSDRRDCRNNNRKKWGYTCGNTNNRYNRWNNDDNDDDDGSNAKSVVVSPNSTEKYTLTITDSKGATKTITQAIKVKDVNGSCGKVLICYEDEDCYYSCGRSCCYHSKRTTVKTYSVSSSYVQYYLSNGAKLGSCGSNKGGDNEIVDVNVAEFKTYPNPTTDVFFVTIPEPGNTQVVVMDMNGKVITQKHQENNLKQSTDIDLSSAANGMYFVRMMNNGKTYSSKLIKQ